MPLHVFCETVELAVEAAALAADLGLAVHTELSTSPLDAAAHDAVATGAPTCALCLALPGAEQAVAALEVCATPNLLVVAALNDSEGLHAGLLGDLGFVATLDVAPAIAALAMLGAGGSRAFRASPRKLSATDRLRISKMLRTTDKQAGRLLSLGAASTGYQAGDRAPVRLGDARSAAEALRALQWAEPVGESGVFRQPDGIDACREVLFGPPRVLSDPASKAALLPFGLPLPQEELCASPSRAAVEATRIGFPVRISLASPDLRIWDYPDLAVDGVDNAARVRDVYRQLSTTAETRAPNARVLGVTVTATTLASALLRVTARPLTHGRVLLRVAFCDPHGAITKDAVATVLPQADEGLIRALERLRGSGLLWSDGQTRELVAPALLALLNSLGSFANIFRREVARVELHPVALLVGGGAEVREAAVQVTDAFVRDVSAG